MTYLSLITLTLTQLNLINSCPTIKLTPGTWESNDNSIVDIPINLLTCQNGFNATNYGLSVSNILCVGDELHTKPNCTLNTTQEININSDSKIVSFNCSKCAKTIINNYKKCQTITVNQKRELIETWNNIYKCSYGTSNHFWPYGPIKCNKNNELEWKDCKTGRSVSINESPMKDIVQGYNCMCSSGFIDQVTIPLIIIIGIAIFGGTLGLILSTMMQQTTKQNIRSSQNEASELSTSRSTTSFSS